MPTTLATSATASNSPRQMTEAEAAWVREHVWTRAMRKVYAETPAIHSMCPCEYGPCGRCSAGRHDRCPYTDPRHAQWAAARADVPAGWVTYADCQVPTHGGTETWQVWEAGVTHDARCPCARAGHPGTGPHHQGRNPHE